MATATAETSNKERLESKRDALALRRAELIELIDSSPMTVSKLRELWIRSESTASERKLQAALRAREAAESELVEVDESIAVVDRLLGEELAREALEAREQLAARLGEMRNDEAEAFKRCGEVFGELFGAWQTLAASQEALQSSWWSSPGREGVQPGHALDPTPFNFQALLDVLYRAALRREDVGYQTVERIAHLVPNLGADVSLELSGAGHPSH
jgi:hypothetical protein